MSHSTDRNALVLLLAMQLGLVSRDAALAAVRAWNRDRSKSLEQFLREQGTLAADGQTLLDALVQQSPPGGNHAPPIPPDTSPGSLAASDSQQLPPTDVYVPSADVDPFATRAPSPSPPTVAGVRFRTLRPHAKGGLGEVFVARDEELPREVALKEIQGRHADDPASRARFLMEAEITGALEHPGIVPVYGKGQYADGRPYYAMRFIRGDSLKDGITAFHAAESPRRDPGERGLALRQLLRRFIDACNAIGYAHSRGIIHRDIKPGNIMLGQYGETLVVDWGLAKAVGRAEISGGSEEAPVAVNSSGNSAATVMGSAIGTPQYMSPEQAAGRLDVLGPATDIYSLGATLYCLLTGKPPIEDTDVGAVLRRVQRGEFPRPRQLKPIVPAPLEAICLKAMALKPEDRYATTRALADDLEHWLADELVAAYREPWRARVRRWSRRHRTAVTTGVGAVAVAIVCLALATLLLTGAYRQVEEQRDRAQARFWAAREVVDKFNTQVSENPEMKARGVERLRTQLLESAVDFYQRFVKEEGHDPEVQAEQGRAYWRLANLYSTTGRTDPAEKAYLTAIGIFRRLVAEHPQQLRFRKDLADSHFKLAVLYVDGGRWTEGEKLHGTALELREALIAANPREAEYQQDLGQSLNNLGILYADTGRKREAEKVHRRALTLRRQLYDADPDSVQHQLDLAHSVNNLGVVLRQPGRQAEALEPYLEALSLRKRLHEAHPDDPQYRGALAGSYNNLGNLYAALNQKDEALKAHQEALRLLQPLAAGHPDVPLYQQWLAQSHNNLGTYFFSTEQFAQATEELEKGLAMRQRLADAYREVPEYQAALGNSHYNLGLLFQTMKRNEDAVREYRTAQDIFALLIKGRSPLPRYFSLLATTNNNLGLIYRGSGNTEEAGKAAQEALKIRQDLSARYPEVVEFQRQVGAAYHNLGLFFWTIKQYPEAEKAYLEVLKIREPLVQKATPEDTEIRADLASTYVNLGTLLRDTDKPNEALNWYGKAIHILEPLLGGQPRTSNVSNWLQMASVNRSEIHRNQGRSLEQLQDLDRAIPLTEEKDRGPLLFLRSVALGKSCNEALVLAEKGENAAALLRVAELAKTSAPTGETYFYLARVCSVASASAQKNGKSAEADAAARQAVGFLVQAKRAGYFGKPGRTEDLDKRAEFEPLRQREDFKKLLADLEIKGPPPEK